MKKTVFFLVSFGLIAVAALLLVQLKSHPRLGRPGIKGEPLPGTIAMKLALPENVLEFTSTNIPEPDIVVNYLPKDSSFIERRYRSPESEAPIEGTVILMGADRTSIHNADFCLRGQGLFPDAKHVVDLPIADTPAYSLPVSRWDVSGTFQQADGQKVQLHGVYVFWFVTEGAQTPGHFDMMKQLAKHVLRTGELQRWAYVSYFSLCVPGQEDATFERMKRLITASVPTFQFPPKSGGTSAIASP